MKASLEESHGSGLITVYMTTIFIILLGIWFSLGYKVPVDETWKEAGVPYYNEEAFEPGVRIELKGKLRELGSVLKTQRGTTVRLEDKDPKTIQNHLWIASRIKPNQAHKVALGIERPRRDSQTADVRIVYSAQGIKPVTFGYQLNLLNGNVILLGDTTWETIKAYKTEDEWIILLDTISPSIPSRIQIILRPDIAKASTGSIDVNFLDVREAP